MRGGTRKGEIQRFQNQDHIHTWTVFVGGAVAHVQENIKSLKCRLYIAVRYYIFITK